MRRLRVTWTSDSGVHLSHHLQDRCTVVHEIDVHVVTKYSEPPDTRYSKQLHTRHSILNNRYLTLDTSRFIRHSTSDIRYNPPPPSWMSCAWYMMNDERWRCTTPEKESLGRKPLRVESRKSHGTRVTSPHPAYAPRRVDSIRFDSIRDDPIRFGSSPSESLILDSSLCASSRADSDRRAHHHRVQSLRVSESLRVSDVLRIAPTGCVHARRSSSSSWSGLFVVLAARIAAPECTDNGGHTRSSLDARRSTLDARRSTLVARRSTLDARRSSLVVGITLARR